MKIQFKSVTVIVATLMFMACSNSAADQNASQGDTTAAVTLQVAPAEPVLTEEGLSPVVIGANVKDLPDAVEGLYASKTFHKIDENLSDEEIGFDEIEGWHFLDKDGNMLFTAEENEGIIYRVIVNSPTIKTAQGAHVGMSRDEALKIEGAKLIKPDPEADYQIYSIELGKISMTLDYEKSQKVINMEVADYSILD